MDTLNRLIVPFNINLIWTYPPRGWLADMLNLDDLIKRELSESLVF